MIRNKIRVRAILVQQSVTAFVSSDVCFKFLVCTDVTEKNLVNLVAT